MDELSYKVEYRPYGEYEIAWLIDRRGVRRRANPEEAEAFEMVKRLKAADQRKQKAKA